MSRIGKLPVNLPAGVTVEVSADNVVSVKGPLGTLSQKVDSDIKVEVGTHTDVHTGKEVPGQNSIFPCKGTVDRKNVKCRCRFQSEGLPAAFRKFSRYFKIWAFRPHSQTSHLPYLPFCPQWQSCTKNGSPGQEAQKASTKGKKIKLTNDYGKHGNKFRRKKGNRQCLTA